MPATRTRCVSARGEPGLGGRFSFASCYLQPYPNPILPAASPLAAEPAPSCSQTWLCPPWLWPLALMCPLPTATKVVSHLIEKLPGSVGDKAPPADVIVNIIAVLNNLVVESPMAARDIVYFDGLRKLFFIKKRRDRWELPAHTWAHVLLSSPSLLSGSGSQISLPKPGCWESLDWLRVTSWPPASPLSPHYCHSCLFPSGNLSLLLQRWDPDVHLLPLPTCTRPPIPLGWSPCTGGHCAMLSGPQNLLNPVPFPAQTMRNPPEPLPASWETCGSTPSSTGTSRWYVPIPEPPAASGRIPRESRPDSSWRGTPPKCFPGYCEAPFHACFSSGMGTFQSIVPVWVGWGWSRGAPCA